MTFQKRELIAVRIPTNVLGVRVTIPFVLADCEICRLKETPCVEMKSADHASAVAYICADCIHGLTRAAIGKVHLE